MRRNGCGEHGVDSWKTGTKSATVKGVIASQSTQFSWPDMALIRLFPSASCVCAWPSYIHSLLVHQMCRHQDSQWHRQFEFRSASSHPCTNEQWVPLPACLRNFKTSWWRSSSMNIRTPIRALTSVSASLFSDGKKQILGLTSNSHCPLWSLCSK